MSKRDEHIMSLWEFLEEFGKVPSDNAVAEATYKIVKTEFAFKRIFRARGARS